MDILSNISERLKELIDETEIKIHDLAEKTGIDQSVISRILNAERMPSTETLVTLADFFNCTIDFMLGLSEQSNEHSFKTRPSFNKQLDFLLEHYQISKYKLEKETRLSEETVNRWHKGKYEPTVESVIRLARYFDCSVDFVLGREV